MDDLSVLGRHGVGLKVGQGANIWMRRGTVVALVVVVREYLPIVVALHLPEMIEDVVVEAELAVAFLSVDAIELLLPVKLRLLLSIHIDPDEAILVDVGVNW